MRLRSLLATVTVGSAIVIALAGCVPAPADGRGSSTPVADAPTPTATPSPTPTTPAVVWQDAQKMIILPNSGTPAQLPHGPSWVSQDGTMKCGIYDDRNLYDDSTGTHSVGVYYGCRIEYGANRFTYPPVDNPGDIGGCPSGFAAAAGHAATALCNSGQVFTSETESATVLMPGNGVRFAGIECVALTAGMSCTETATAHGFRVTLDEFSLT